MGKSRDVTRIDTSPASNAVYRSTDVIPRLNVGGPKYDNKWNADDADRYSALTKEDLRRIVDTMNLTGTELGRKINVKVFKVINMHNCPILTTVLKMDELLEIHAKK